MNISVFGLGYVGTVVSGCLSQMGHRVVAVDINEKKVQFINEGKSPIFEQGTDAIIAEQRNAGMISATTNGVEAAKKTDISFICVGTPSTPNGHLKLDSVYRVASDIGTGIAQKSTFHTVVIRSTVVPGTNAHVSSIVADSSGKKTNQDFAVVSNPEFLREGTAVKDFNDPPFTLLGSMNRQALDAMREIYADIDAQIVETDISVAEMIKYVNNTFHALKVVFANEVGNICKHLNIDARKLMEVFCLDTKLNISPSYLRPGFAYGGSCLPKDHKALRTLAHDGYLECPIIEGIETSNEVQKKYVLERIMEYRKKKIGFLGLSFKTGTDDLRNSPIVDILEQLLGKGFTVRIYDRNIHLAQLMGANRDFILERIPLISQFVVNTVDDIVDFAELIVIVNKDHEFIKLLEKIHSGTIVYDLVNLGINLEERGVEYEGISW